MVVVSLATSKQQECGSFWHSFGPVRIYPPPLLGDGIFRGRASWHKNDARSALEFTWQKIQSKHVLPHLFGSVDDCSPRTTPSSTPLLARSAGSRTQVGVVENCHHRANPVHQRLSIRSHTTLLSCVLFRCWQESHSLFAEEEQGCIIQLGHSTPPIRPHHHDYY
jgi:hypothetical protein